MYDSQQPPAKWPVELDRAAQDLAGTVRAVRQLLPFPGTDVTTLPLMSPTTNSVTQPAGSPTAAGAVAADIVSQAAAILDQEMAKGVVAAQRAPVSGPAHAGSPPVDILQQVRDLIDNVARIWPTTGSVLPAEVATRPATSASPSAPLPTLKPATSLRPGDQTTITMTIRNHEDQAVSLVPAATPLLGSTGERIAVQLIELTPAQLRLEPGQQQELRATITVPARCSPGCYSGLLVVSGVAYLRALITLEVTS